MWVMSTVRRKDGIHVYIGAVKIAECCWLYPPDGGKIKYFLRLMFNHVAYDVEGKDLGSITNCLQELHRLLNSPPPEGNTVGRERNQREPLPEDFDQRTNDRGT